MESVRKRGMLSPATDGEASDGLWLNVYCSWLWIHEWRVLVVGVVRDVELDIQVLITLDFPLAVVAKVELAGMPHETEREYVWAVVIEDIPVVESTFPV